MLQLTNTPNYAGVMVSGDLLDFEELYEALHLISDDEGEDEGFEQVRLRVLDVCYHLTVGEKETSLPMGTRNSN